MALISRYSLGSGNVPGAVSGPRNHAGTGSQRISGKVEVRMGWGSGERLPGGGDLGWGWKDKAGPCLSPCLQGLYMPSQVCLDSDTAQRQVSFNPAV